MRDAGGGDLVWDFGMRMATEVASRITGFPPEDGAMLYGLVQRFMGREEGVDGMTPGRPRRDGRDGRLLRGAGREAARGRHRAAHTRSTR